MYYVIVNPGSGSGRGYYTWKKLEEGFIVAGLKYKAASTKKAGDAKRLTTSLMERIQLLRSPHMQVSEFVELRSVVRWMSLTWLKVRNLPPPAVI